MRVVSVGGIGGQAELDAQIEHGNAAAAKIDEAQHVGRRFRNPRRLTHVEDFQDGFHRNGEHFPIDREGHELTLAAAVFTAAFAATAFMSQYLSNSLSCASAPCSPRLIEKPFFWCTAPLAGAPAPSVLTAATSCLACTGPFLAEKRIAAGAATPGARALIVRAEEGDAGLQLLGLRGQFLRGRRHLLGGDGVLLDHLVELLDRLVDLIRARRPARGRRR